MEMTQTRFAAALAVAAALAGGFLLGRATAPSSGTDATDDTPCTVESRAPASAFETSGDRDGHAQTSQPQQTSAPHPAATAFPSAGTMSPAPGRAQDIPPAGGPRPLLPADGDALAVLESRGVGTGSTQDPYADWQRLSVALTGEPWFNETFDHMQTMIGDDAGRAVYLTVYTRCTPGNCRFGSGRR
jgi:hypothetical protein